MVEGFRAVGFRVLGSRRRTSNGEAKKPGNSESRIMGTSLLLNPKPSQPKA